MKILICGYYGEHNLGDDALLQCLLWELPSGWQPLVTAADQHEVQDRFQVATCDRRSLPATLKALAHCSALVLGGGSLLQDSTSFKSLIYYAALILAAKLKAKPILLWGQGLGPLRRRRSRILVRLLLPLVTVASWRDPESAALAAQLGRGAASGDLLGSDPVWRFPPALAGPRGTNCCGLAAHAFASCPWLAAAVGGPAATGGSAAKRSALVTFPSPPGLRPVGRINGPGPFTGGLG